MCLFPRNILTLARARDTIISPWTSRHHHDYLDDHCLRVDFLLITAPLAVSIVDTKQFNSGAYMIMCAGWFCTNARCHTTQVNHAVAVGYFIIAALATCVVSPVCPSWQSACLVVLNRFQSHYNCGSCS